MDANETNRLDALKRAYVFLTGTPLPPPLQNNPPQGLSDEVTALKTAIDAATTAAQAQQSGAVHQVTAQRQALRAALRKNHLSPILHVAHVLAKTTPGLPHLVNIKTVRGEQALIAAAQAAVTDLTPYKALFIAKGFPADFLDQLQSAVTALIQSADEQRDAQIKRTQSSTGLEAAIKDGMDAKRILNAIFRRYAATDPDGDTFLRGWEAASYVRRLRTSASTTPSTPNSSSPSAPETPSTNTTPSPTATAQPAPSTPSAAVTSTTGASHE